MYARNLQQILFDISENGFALTIENTGYIHDTICIMISKSHTHVVRYVTKDELNMSNIDNDLHIRIILEDLLKEMKKAWAEVLERRLNALKLNLYSPEEMKTEIPVVTGTCNPYES